MVKACERLRDKHVLDQGAWDSATLEFLNFLLGGTIDALQVCMTKARKMGWHGCAGTWDEFQRAFEELEEAKMLPPAGNSAETQ